MYSSLITGAESHKTLSMDSNPILRLYYTDKIVLFIVCAMDQLFYVCVYLLGWSDKHTGDMIAVGKDGNAFVGRYVLWVLLVVSGGFFALKQFLNGVQLVGASINLAKQDQVARSKGKEKVR
ncbi:hypothetical protein HDU76_003404 [Blyttiomyces sp. JEL0837]|nr:hypothetical protein HDU76_003404 [Blyttiomyces sp. JEL0837]